MPTYIIKNFSKRVAIIENNSKKAIENFVATFIASQFTYFKWYQLYLSLFWVYFNFFIEITWESGSLDLILFSSVFWVYFNFFIEITWESGSLVLKVTPLLAKFFTYIFNKSIKKSLVSQYFLIVFPAIFKSFVFYWCISLSQPFSTINQSHF